jgi:alkanesulfonate monooxygenase SsuD/methylene tetrahydromethanopterin reductase-like flavin-dependent oxidoreductase (luciferase family)
MHVGYGAAFQNPNNAIPDDEAFRQEVRFCEMAEPLGFESIWAAEHHFTDYTMSPDTVQFLTYMAGRTTHVKLGSMVIVLPWHDPIRVAEQVSMIDHLSSGRYVLGLGRGLARVEYEGFRVDQNEGRELFVENAELLLNALEKGYMEGGRHANQPRRDIRPFPRRSFRGRTYAAAVSPESMPIMAKLGVGVLIIPQKPWEVVKQEFEVYKRVWHETNATEPPKPLSLAFVFVDEDKARAEEVGFKYIAAYNRSALKHYEMLSEKFGTHKSYEHYGKVNKLMANLSPEDLDKGFVKLMPCGTPDQVLEKYAVMREATDLAGTMVILGYGGMPYDEVERNIKCFATKVMPELKKWPAAPLVEPAPLPRHSAARAA